MRRASTKARPEAANGFRVYRVLSRGRGWRAGFSLKGVRYFKYFADSSYGSAEASRKAAERFATQNHAIHEELLGLRRRFEVRTNSRSGIPGVSRYEGEEGRGPYWFAYWDDRRGRRVSRRFSVRRLGEAQAFAMAVSARESAVRPFRDRYEELLKLLGLEAEAQPAARLPRRRR